MTPHPDITATTPATNITSDQITHTTRHARQRQQDVPWLPGQLPGRDTTTTVLLAGTSRTGDQHGGHRLRPRAQGRAEEPGLTGPAATAPASQPPRGFAPQQDRASGLPVKGPAD